MTSGKQARKQRQAAATRPPVRSTEGRRASPTVLLAALAGVLGIALAVVLVIVFTGGSSGSSGVTGTPTIFVGRAGAAKPTEVTPGRSPSVAELSAVIDQALKG